MSRRAGESPASWASRLLDRGPILRDRVLPRRTARYRRPCGRRPPKAARMSANPRPFRVLVTANAFVESGEAAARPLIAAGAEVIPSPRPGPLPVPELLRWLEGCDAVIASSDPYTGEVLAACPRLKLIARWGVG